MYRWFRSSASASQPGKDKPHLCGHAHLSLRNFDLSSLFSPHHSVSLTISFNCRMLSGPKTLSGGWFSVARQYCGERRKRSIRFVLVAVPVAFFMCPPPIIELVDSNRHAKAKQLDESIGNTLVLEDRRAAVHGYYFGVQAGCPVNRPLTNRI